MVVASANEFRANQKKYLDLAKQDVPVFLKRGGTSLPLRPFRSSSMRINLFGCVIKRPCFYAVDETEKTVQIYSERYHYSDK